jgi:hypothetical protein
MTNCWSEGALRAYLDRELPPEDMKSVAVHLGECVVCDELCAELAGRAARVFALLETLPAPEKVTKVRPMPRPAVTRWLWPGAAVAVAAGLAVASFIVQKREEAQSAVRVVPPVIAEAPVTVAPLVIPQPPAARTAATRPVARKRQPVTPLEYFVALDDEPIESGVIMRVAIEPGNTKADIVFDPEGRARAIRLVNHKY